jgi:hypothetical protein
LPSGIFDFCNNSRGAAARSDEDEFDRHRCDTAVKDVLDRDAPAPVVLAVEANDLPTIVNVEAGLIGQVFDQQMGQRAIVDLAAGDDASCREWL